MKRFTMAAALVLALILSPSALAAGSVTGTWKTTVRSGDFAGAYTIKFSHGKYRVSQGSTVIVRGDYTLSGSKIRLDDTSGPAACADPGQYRYQRHGRKLTFTVKQDDCQGRPAILPRTWTKV